MASGVILILRGDTVIDYQFDFCGPFLNGRAKVKYQGREGIVGRNGELYFNAGDETITILNENISLINSGKRSGILDEKGGVLYETGSQLKPLASGILEIAYTGALGLFNNRGANILEPFYDEITEGAAQNVFIARRNNKQGVVDQEGNWIVPLTSEYDEVIGYSEGFLSIKLDGKYGLY